MSQVNSRNSSCFSWFWNWVGCCLGLKSLVWESFSNQFESLGCFFEFDCHAKDFFWMFSWSWFFESAINRYLICSTLKCHSSFELTKTFCSNFLRSELNWQSIRWLWQVSSALKKWLGFLKSCLVFGKALCLVHISMMVDLSKSVNQGFAWFQKDFKLSSLAFHRFQYLNTASLLS